MAKGEKNPLTSSLKKGCKRIDSGTCGAAGSQCEWGGNGSGTCLPLPNSRQAEKRKGPGNEALKREESKRRPQKRTEQKSEGEAKRKWAETKIVHSPGTETAEGVTGE